MSTAHTSKTAALTFRNENTERYASVELIEALWQALRQPLERCAPYKPFLRSTRFIPLTARTRSKQGQSKNGSFALKRLWKTKQKQ
jgi:hypothetical protein